MTAAVTPGRDALDARIQTQRYAIFRLLRANAPHERLREEWSKLETLLDTPSSNGAEGAGHYAHLGSADMTGTTFPNDLAVVHSPPQPAPDAMRNALERIIRENQVSKNVCVEVDPAGNTYAVMMVDGQYAQIARVALALSAPVPSPDEPDYESAARALGFMRTSAGNWIHPKDNFTLRRRYVSAEAIFSREVPGLLSPSAPSPDWAGLADDIRALGWTVAVHNDYRQDGQAHTFWLFTKGRENIKGEGHTDAEALNQIRAVLSPSGARAAEPVAWRWQHVNDRREPRPWHYEDAPWKGNEYMQAEPLYAAPLVSGERETIARDHIQAVKVTIPQSDFAKASDEYLSGFHNGAKAQLDAILSLPSAPVSKPTRWYLACQNDGLFIINAEPRPSNDDQRHDRPGGPSIVLNVTELPEAKAIKIVGVMNELMAAPVSGRDAVIEDRVRAVLREHWLTGILCNHTDHTDVASCFCTVWTSGPKPSVNDAVEVWIEHVVRALSNHKESGR